jgi:hypothetical protein
MEDFSDIELRTKLLKEKNDLVRRGRLYEYIGGALIFGAAGMVIVGEIMPDRGTSAALAVGIIGIGLLLSIGGASCLIQAAITEKLLALDEMQSLRRGETIGARITRDVRGY